MPRRSRRQKPATKVPIVEAAAKGKIELIRNLINNESDINLTNSRNETALHVAAKWGQYKTVTYLLDNNADINLPNSSQRTPLSSALTHDQFEIVRLLIERGANFDCSDNKGVTPLHLAVRCTSLPAIMYLIYSRCQANAADKDGNTPLHHSVLLNQQHIMRFLVYHCELDLSNNDHLTPLSLATKMGYKDIVKILVEKGASTTNPVATCSPIFIAVKLARFSILEYLIDQGVDMNAVDQKGHNLLIYGLLAGTSSEIVKLLLPHFDINSSGEAGITPLCVAMEQNRIKLVKLFVLGGADVNLASRISATPRYRNEYCHWPNLPDTGLTVFSDKPSVHTASDDTDGLIKFLTTYQDEDDILPRFQLAPILVASYTGNFEIVRYLLDRGADVNVATADGCNALLAAVCHNQLAVVEILVDASANSMDNLGRTPLFLAAQQDFFEIVKFLIKKHADIDARNAEGLTPLMAAINSKHEAMAKYLVSYGADINAVGPHNLSIIHYAAQSGLLETIEMCVSRGADANRLDDFGMTPLCYAKINNHFEMVRLLQYWNSGRCYLKQK